MIKPTLVRYIDFLQTVNDLNGRYSTFKERCGNVFDIALLHSSKRKFKLKIPSFVCLLK